MAKSFDKLSPAEQIAAIRSKLGHLTMKWRPKFCMDTGSPELNTVFGHPKRGILFGYMLELSGPESNGKTAVALDLTALCQDFGAICLWADIEASFDKVWAETRGVDTEKLFLFQPYIGRFKRKKKKGEEAQVQEGKNGKEKPGQMSSAEVICSEIEATLQAMHDLHPDKPKFIVVDSVTAFLTEEESGAGIRDQNMRSKLALASFLNRLLRRWVGLMQATNTTILFINQLRVNPMQMFGNPEYSPGGKALKFYCHGRATLRRAAKGGQMRKSGKIIGLQGVIKSIKNKMGGFEEAEVGYKLYRSGKSVYTDAARIKLDAKGK